ncbi:MAG: ammonium transporter [Pseudomonas sp.]
MTLRKYAGLGTLAALACPTVVMAAEEAAEAAAPVLNSGDTAWMLTSTLLVLMMTIPGLALFYGGMVRAKNILSVMMQCFAITGLVSVLWVIYGYSIAFDTTGMEAGVVNLNSFIGGLSKAFLSGLTATGLTSATALFPESVFITFQMTFAIITPALIVGAFAERMKFSAMLLFTAVWFTLVYAPIAHMVWGGNGALMWDWGVLDFAGGTVVHINAGIAGLVACLVIGKRKGYPTSPMAPHNLTYTLLGAAMLWIGWFGFNAGSAVAANGTAGMAMLVTQIATAAAALSWMFAEWITHGKPSALGIASGVVAGLVAITPAAGTAGPMGALAIGLVSGAVCFFCATSLKRKMGYDDSLDAFGVHGVGGIVGALLTGVFAAPALGGFGTVEDIGLQLWIQFKGVIFTVIYTGIITYVILKALDMVMGLRVNEESEQIGLDLSEHNERGYNL